MTDIKGIIKAQKTHSQKMSEINSTLKKISQILEKQTGDQDSTKKEEATPDTNNSYFFGSTLIAAGMIICMISLLIYLYKSVFPAEDILGIAFIAPNNISEIKYLITLKYILCFFLFLGFCGALLGVYKIYTQHLKEKAELEAKARQDNLSFTRFFLQHQLDSERQQKL